MIIQLLSFKGDRRFVPAFRYIISIFRFPMLISYKLIKTYEVQGRWKTYADRFQTLFVVMKRFAFTSLCIQLKIVRAKKISISNTFYYMETT